MLILNHENKNLLYEDHIMTHDEIVSAYENYLAENESFETKNIKAAAARARKALGNLAKLAKVRRAEIQERKTNL